MTDTYMPDDSNSQPMPVLGYKKGSAQTITANAGGTARNATAFNAKVVSVFCDQPVRIAMGDSSVTALATDAYIPANTYLDISLIKDTKRHTYIAVRTVGATAGTFEVAERE